MTRKLYGWEKDGRFYLSAFARPRAHDDKRPAAEYESRAALDADVTQRRVDLVWEDGN